jgi:hypothetical protein
MVDFNLVSGLCNLLCNRGKTSVINIPEYDMIPSGSDLESHQTTQPTTTTGNQYNLVGKVAHNVSFLTTATGLNFLCDLLCDMAK